MEICILLFFLMEIFDMGEVMFVILWVKKLIFVNN